MTVAVTALSKSEKLGLNKFLDRLFLQKQEALGPEAGFLKRQLNKLRLKMDYFDILEMASNKKFPAPERKNAFWAGLDANKISEVDVLYDKLTARKGMLNDIEKKVFESIPGFQKRLNAARLLATGIITAATVYLIGGVAMKIVYKFIAPFDHDFDPNAGAGSKGKITPHRMQAISLHQPSAFQSFAAGRIAENPMQFRGSGQGLRGETPHV
jgi:hypothetical protein